MPVTEQPAVLMMEEVTNGDVPIPGDLGEDWKYWLTLICCLGLCAYKDGKVACSFKCGMCCVKTGGDAIVTGGDGIKAEEGAIVYGRDGTTAADGSSVSGIDSSKADGGAGVSARGGIQAGKGAIVYGRDGTTAVGGSNVSGKDEAVKKDQKKNKRKTDDVPSENDTDDEDTVTDRRKAKPRKEVPRAVAYNQKSTKNEDETDHESEPETDSADDEQVKLRKDKNRTKRVVEPTSEDDDEVTSKKGKAKGRKAHKTDKGAGEGNEMAKSDDEAKKPAGKNDKTEVGSPKEEDGIELGPGFVRNPSIKSNLLMDFLKEKVKRELETDGPRLCGSNGIGGLVENSQFLEYLGSFKIIAPDAIQQVESETTRGTKTRKLIGHLVACSSRQIFAFVWVLIAMNHSHHLTSITTDVKALMKEYTKDIMERMQ